MFESYLIHPEYQPYIARAHHERAEALSRVAYLAVLGVDWVFTRTARALGGGFRHIARGYELWQRRRLTVQALSRLDERMLRDIGLAPGDIEAIAAELVQTDKRVPAPVARPIAVSTRPQLILNLDCPDLKHAA